MPRPSHPKILTQAVLIFIGLIGCSVPTSNPATPAPLPISTSPPEVVVNRLPTATLTLSAVQTETQPTPGPMPSPAPALPKEHYILKISGHHQYFSLGCETAAAKDWANYFGQDFNEFEFQYKLPLSDNPDLGFVGDVNSPWGQVPPYGYGVHASPIADLLNAYGIPAKAIKGFTLEKLKTEISQDKPLIAWVIGNVVGGIPTAYTDRKGNQTIVAAYEHVIIVTGYSPTSIRYMNNGKFYVAPEQVFLNSWGVLDNMVVVR